MAVQGHAIAQCGVGVVLCVKEGIGVISVTESSIRVVGEDGSDRNWLAIVGAAVKRVADLDRERHLDELCGVECCGDGWVDADADHANAVHRGLWVRVETQRVGRPIVVRRGAVVDGTDLVGPVVRGHVVVEASGRVFNDVRVGGQRTSDVDRLGASPVDERHGGVVERITQFDRVGGPWEGALVTDPEPEVGSLSRLHGCVARITSLGLSGEQRALRDRRCATRPDSGRAGGPTIDPVIGPLKGTELLGEAAGF